MTHYSGAVWLYPVGDPMMRVITTLGDPEHYPSSMQHKRVAPITLHHLYIACWCVLGALLIRIVVHRGCTIVDQVCISRTTYIMRAMGYPRCTNCYSHGC